MSARAASETVSALRAVRGWVFLRRAIIVVVAVTAATAVFAGLARLGVAVEIGGPRAMEHGPLFVVGAFGTIIALERAVALRRPLAVLAPALGAAAAVTMILGPLPFAHAFAALFAIAFVVVNAAILQRSVSTPGILMLAGAGALALGTSCWSLDVAVSRIVLSWIAFFVLTIIAERVELSHLAPTPRWATRAVVALAALLALAGAVALISEGHVAARVAGAALLLLGAWQLRFDIARRTIRQRGLPRFAALGILAGSGWLCVSGAVLVVAGLPPAGPIYDAALHSIFIGFALSMVFAHAPIILPAIAQVTVPYRPVFYAPLTLLHAGLLARIAGDVAGAAELRTAGSVVSAIALAAFAMAVLVARASARDGQTRHAAQR